MIDDPFAEPLVRAVGVDFLTRWATGELTAADVDDEGTSWGLAQMPAAMAARTRYFDAVLRRRRRSRHPAGRDPGLRPGRPRLPTGLARGHDGVRDRPARAVIEFKTTTLAGLGAAPTADRRARSRSTCATTGPPHCRPPASTPPSRRRGSPRACSATCRPRRRTGCSTPSPRSARRAAGWAARPCRTPPTSTPRRRASGCASPPPSGASTASTSTSPS